jgi:hypothetical protein
MSVTRQLITPRLPRQRSTNALGGDSSRNKRVRHTEPAARVEGFASVSHQERTTDLTCSVAYINRPCPERISYDIKIKISHRGHTPEHRQRLIASDRSLH